MTCARGTGSASESRGGREEETYGAEEEVREIRLVDNLLHERGEDLGSETVGHREADGDGCDDGGKGKRRSLVRAKGGGRTLDRFLQSHFRVVLVKVDHELDGRERIATSAERIDGTEVSGRGDDGEED